MKELTKRDGSLICEDEYCDLLEDFFGFTLPRRFRNSGFSPSLDIVETENSFEITTDLPGIEEKDIKIELKNNQLTISGTREREENYSKGKVHRSERFYGSFLRSINLTSNANQESIKASFKNGTLKIHIPKKESEKSKFIKIES